MPTYNICKKCGTPTATSDIGTNGICRSCMQEAIQNSKQARKNLGNGTERQNLLKHGKHPVKPLGAVTLSKPIGEMASSCKEFANKKEVAEYLGVSVQKVNAAIRFKKNIDGWEIG